MEFSHRQRTNTAQRLEKLDLERKKASKIKHIKWEYNPTLITLEQQKELFKSKDFRNNRQNIQRKSLFAEQLEKCPELPQNPFVEYARFDGNVSIAFIFENKIVKFNSQIPVHFCFLLLHF